MYFGFYTSTPKELNAVAPLKNMHAPTPLPIAHTTQRASLEILLAAVHHASPSAHLFSISNATLEDATVYASMDLAMPGNFLHRDILCIDAANGHILSVWHYAEKHSLGDWILWRQHPLHFGTQMGLWN